MHLTEVKVILVCMRYQEYYKVRDNRRKINKKYILFKNKLNLYCIAV